VNAYITSLGAICGLYPGEIPAMKKTRNVLIAVMKEVSAFREKPV
jgi:hypothetical protein